jgi:hypothetical protein
VSPISVDHSRHGSDHQIDTFLAGPTSNGTAA